MRAILVALLSLAQFVPTGFAVASGDEGVELVICTADGAKSVSWDSLTGEASPYDQPSEHSDPDCAACLTSCRIAAADISALVHFSHTCPEYESVEVAFAAAAPAVHAARPPMPSRAPPASSI
ncbi:DUF2946 family protein [Hyphococcus sp. DH-69]|uniref:DUF2946 family protein n=1 Tax=Hyphococcus formosus TaxID=3143534 RepID=UPI00398BB6CC